MKISIFKQVGVLSSCIWLAWGGALDASAKNVKHWTKSASTDTLHYENKYGFIVLATKVNGENKKLIFDTGADITLLNNEAGTKEKESNVSITDGAGNKSAERYRFDVVKKLEISTQKYKDVKVVLMDLPKPFTCISDGILGNNIIRLQNWVITPHYLVATVK
jgi:hypothetical protein